MAIQKVDYPLPDYFERTSKSLEWMKKAKEVMPGGVTANIKSFDPYPIVMEKGNGAHLTDVNGNEYIDYLLAYGALMLGHGHEKITEAITKQLHQNGTCLFGTPHELEYTFGKKIQQHYPSMELLRYTNSGTEATLLALRLAYAYTGKYKIAKFEGHYHGGYNEVLVSVSPPLNEAGEELNPNSVIDSKGVPEKEAENTIILPFNELEACEAILKRHQHELAAVMIEPVQGGFIPATEKFIKGLREITKELGILLIFDEVKTGFRVAIGGAQQLYQVKPDITALGKVIGGGFPIGIVGGREEIMLESSPRRGADVFDSSQSKKSKSKDVLFHSGTYNGHPMILAAGLATVEVLEEKIEDVFKNTAFLKQQLEQLFKRYKIGMKAVGIGSIFSVVLTNKENIRNYRDLQQTDLSLRKEIDLHLLNEGIYTKPLNRYSLSTAHGKKEIDATIKAYERVLSKVCGGHH